MLARLRKHLHIPKRRTTTEKNIPTPTILDRLAPELLAHIFTFLVDRQKDIASLRLVCKTLHELSSPHLITRVVFATRFDTLTRLYEVLNHRYFSQFVTHLIYDASQYDDQLNRHDHRTRRSTSERKLVQDTSIDEEEAFKSYVRRVRQEWAIKEQFKDLKRLKGVLERLPKLRHIIFTDYRALRRENETFHECCDRLFGYTLEPDHLSYARYSWFFRLPGMLRVVGDVPSLRVESLDIAPHTCIAPWQNSGEYTSKQFMRETQGIFTLRFLTGCRDEEFGKMLVAMRKLQNLRFPFFEAFQEEESVTRFIQLLEAAAPSLRDLTLLRPAAKGPTKKHDLNCGSVASEILKLNFPRLECLDLRYLRMFSAELLQEFLARHASTLKELRLVDCLQKPEGGVQDMEAVAVRLADWAGANMLRLTGVEIVHCHHISSLRLHLTDLANNADERLSEENEGYWPRANEILGEVHEMVKAIEEQESMWLSGRKNSLDRTVDIAPSSNCALDELHKWWLSCKDYC